MDAVDELDGRVAHIDKAEHGRYEGEDKAQDEEENGGDVGAVTHQVVFGMSAVQTRCERAVFLVRLGLAKVRVGGDQIVAGLRGQDVVEVAGAVVLCRPAAHHAHTVIGRAYHCQ